MVVIAVLTAGISGGLYLLAEYQFIFIISFYPSATEDI